MKQKLDVDRCFKAMENIQITGAPTGEWRQRAIMDAISRIQTDGATALVKEFIATKDYAQFRDQRCDLPYGYGPKHGDIVFSIRRKRTPYTMGPDEIYYLEAYRDFGVVSHPDEQRHPMQVQRPVLTLADVLERLQKARSELILLDGWVEAATVESHEAAAQ